MIGVRRVAGTVKALIRAGAGEYGAKLERADWEAFLLLVRRADNYVFLLSQEQNRAVRGKIQIEDTVICTAGEQISFACDGAVLTIEMEGNCLHVKMQGCTKPLAKFCEQER